MVDFIILNMVDFIILNMVDFIIYYSRQHTLITTFKISMVDFIIYFYRQHTSITAWSYSTAEQMDVVDFSITGKVNQALVLILFI